MGWETLAMRPKTLYLDVIEDNTDPCCLILPDSLPYLIQTKTPDVQVRTTDQLDNILLLGYLIICIFLSVYVMFYDMWINTSLLPDFDLLWGKH